MNIEDIAKTCHEANRALCIAHGDNSQFPWESAEKWQKDSAIKGVEFIFANPNALPSATHDSWLEEKRLTGWKYGTVKDPVKKEHPCFVPYDKLPPEQKAKDYVFGAVARSLLPLLQPYSTAETVGGLQKDNNGIVHSFGEDGKRYADLSQMHKPNAEEAGSLRDFKCKE